LYIYFLTDYSIALLLFAPLHWQFQSSGNKILFFFLNTYVHPHTVLLLISNLPDPNPNLGFTHRTLKHCYRHFFCYGFTGCLCIDLAPVLMSSICTFCPFSHIYYCQCIPSSLIPCPEHIQPWQMLSYLKQAAGSSFSVSFASSPESLPCFLLP